LYKPKHKNLITNLTPKMKRKVVEMKDSKVKRDHLAQKPLGMESTAEKIGINLILCNPLCIFNQTKITLPFLFLFLML
jgi:hypothetical protein